MKTNKLRIYFNLKSRQFIQAESYPGADWVVPKLNVTDSGTLYHLEKQDNRLVQVPVILI
jgi:hypothetical protein